MSAGKLVSGILANTAMFAVPLFLTAWTLDWWRAWVLVGIAVLGAGLAMTSLARINPELLEERFKPPVQKGQPRSDRIAVAALLVTYTGLLVFIPLDVFHFHLFPRPGLVVSTLGLVLFNVGWWVAYLSLRANAFAIPVVKYQEARQHQVADTGVYAIVRHPMYAGAVVVMIGLPLWLESYAGALFAALPIAALVVRIGVEERFLRSHLAGYPEYTERVRYRLIPAVW